MELITIPLEKQFAWWLADQSIGTSSLPGLLIHMNTVLIDIINYVLETLSTCASHGIHHSNWEMYQTLLKEGIKLASRIYIGL